MVFLHGSLDFFAWSGQIVRQLQDRPRIACRSIVVGVGRFDCCALHALHGEKVRTQDRQTLGPFGRRDSSPVVGLLVNQSRDLLAERIPVEPDPQSGSVDDLAIDRRQGARHAQVKVRHRPFDFAGRLERRLASRRQFIDLCHGAGSLIG